jgi:hypothetical protein
MRILSAAFTDHEACLARTRWRRIDAEDLADQSCQRCHGATGGAAGDPGDRIALLGARVLVHDDTHRPVPLRHLLRGDRDDDEPEAVELDVAEAASFDLKAMAKLHEPFVGFTIICPGTHGHTKSQLQFS